MSLLNLFQQAMNQNGIFLNNQGMGMGFPPNEPLVFNERFHAYSPAFWNSENRDKLENGDKIVLPASSLEKLSRMQVQFPIMFEISNVSDLLPSKSHCSVMEFTAPEGCIYMPLWMIDNLGLHAAGESQCDLKVKALPKGQFVKFQAHETRFAMLSNPRVVLEQALRAYSCLTVGDTIKIKFASDVFKLDVKEVKPSHSDGTCPPAISIIETDIKVDFAEPRDYKDWQKQAHADAKRKNQTTQKAIEEAEKDEDGFFVKQMYNINDEEKKEANLKKSHFESLEKMGLQANTLKKKENTKVRKNNYKPMKSFAFNKSERGTPLGTSKNVKVPSKSNENKKKVEEVIGNMRYIYEVDALGNKTVLRRLPLRANLTSQAHNLKK